jgi:hypothetical protein
MDAPNPVAFKITPIGRAPEEIAADSIETDGDPPQYVFRKKGNVVRKLFIHSLETEPEAVFPMTQKQKDQWRKFRKKAGGNPGPNLIRD